MVAQFLKILKKIVPKNILRMYFFDSVIINKAKNKQFYKKSMF